jgi:carbon storage regulator CsrA
MSTPSAGVKHAVRDRWFTAGLHRRISLPMSTESSTPEPEPEDRQGLELVVERKTGESVVIGEEIEIKLVRVRGDRAHIGVQAPEGVPIVRSEVHRAASRDS